MKIMRTSVFFLAIWMMNTLLVPSSVFAQQTTQPPTQPPSQQEQDTEQDADASDDVADNSEPQTDNDLPDIDNQPIQPGAGGPGRFIPSEQISQDLGVSFPVDI